MRASTSFQGEPTGPSCSKLVMRRASSWLCSGVNGSAAPSRLSQSSPMSSSRSSVDRAWMSMAGLAMRQGCSKSGSRTSWDVRVSFEVHEEGLEPPHLAIPEPKSGCIAGRGIAPNQGFVDRGWARCGSFRRSRDSWATIRRVSRWWPGPDRAGTLIECEHAWPTQISSPQMKTSRR